MKMNKPVIRGDEPPMAMPPHVVTMGGKVRPILKSDGDAHRHDSVKTRGASTFWTCGGVVSEHPAGSEMSI
jgi:hypothetical protein